MIQWFGNEHGSTSEQNTANGCTRIEVCPALVGRMYDFVMIYPLVMTVTVRHGIGGPRIDASPFLKMVDLSMANC